MGGLYEALYYLCYWLLYPVTNYAVKSRITSYLFYQHKATPNDDRRESVKLDISSKFGEAIKEQSLFYDKTVKLQAINFLQYCCCADKRDKFLIGKAHTRFRKEMDL